jgi:hypothetical protein
MKEKQGEDDLKGVVKNVIESGMVPLACNPSAGEANLGLSWV